MGNLKDNDELVFVLQYDEDKKHIALHIKCDKSLTPAQYLLALIDFVQDAESKADELFDEFGYSAALNH